MVWQEHLQRIDDLLSKNEVKKAEVIVAKQLRSDLPLHSRSQMLFRRARIRLLSARPEDALDDLQTIQRLVPSEANLPPPLELLGDCYFARFELASLGFADRNDILQAQRLYEQIIQDHPKYANLGWVFYQLGRIWVTINETKAAVQCFQQALLAPSHLSALTAYCYERLAFVAYYEQRDLDQSIAFLNRAVDTYPASGDRNWLAQVHILRSRALRGMKNYEAALSAAELALSLVSRNNDDRTTLSEALLMSGELLAELKNRDRDVVAILQQFIQNAKKPVGVDVTWSRINEMLGNAYFNLGQYDDAILAYRAVLQLNPDHPWALSLYYRIARCYYQLRAYRAAIDALHQMLEMASTEAELISDYRVYDILGNSYFALGQYEDAAGAYQTAIRIAPPNAESLSTIQSYYALALERV
jgi:tetratricopeptide (TPR) repeat protein